MAKKSRNIFTKKEIACNTQKKSLHTQKHTQTHSNKTHMLDCVHTRRYCMTKLENGNDG